MIIIRKAGKEDIEQVAGLFDLYCIFYEQPSDITAAKNFLQERIEKEESVIFIAENENEIIGFTQLYPIFSSVGMKRCWLLNDLYVHAKARSQGIAAELLKAAKEHGLQTNSGWLLLQTSADNYSAQSVYEKNGWNKIKDFFYEMPLNK
jgi:GNAT superfamily N-acetyltransferase